MNVRDLAADFVVDTRWEALSEAVRQQARRCLVDNLAATLSGTQTPVSQIAAEVAAGAWPGDEATVLRTGRRCGEAGAAFANAWSANSLDADDGLRYAYGHGGAQIFPTALALAEARGLDGARTLAAMVVGYEVAHRVGRCWHDSRRVYQACGSWGSVACAATAANLMGLGAEQAWQALGIAEYHAPNAPMMRDIDDPAMVKHAIGWGAWTGIASAGLAGREFTGIPSLLQLEAYEDWVADIGDAYLMVGGVAWKQEGYACCSWAHAAARAARNVVDDHGIALNDIAAIRVEGFHETVRLGTELPETTEEAQFNVAWPVAAMLVDGEIGPAQTLEARLDDPDVRAVARKVELVETEELNELVRLYEQGDPRGRFASRVRITREDGATFTSGLVDEGSCFPNPAWGQETMDDKFRWLTRPVLHENRIDGLLNMAWHFERVENVRSFVAVLRRSLKGDRAQPRVGGGDPTQGRQRHP